MTGFSTLAPTTIPSAPAAEPLPGSQPAAPPDAQLAQSLAGVQAQVGGALVAPGGTDVTPAAVAGARCCCCCGGDASGGGPVPVTVADAPVPVLVPEPEPELEPRPEPVDRDADAEPEPESFTGRDALLGIFGGVLGSEEKPETNETPANGGPSEFADAAARRLDIAGDDSQDLGAASALGLT